MDQSTEITQLLRRATEGENAAVNQLMPMIYGQLRALARRQLVREGNYQTLTATALVNEAYLALLGNTHLNWQDRGHFFAYAARAMRSILIDHARERLADKRGGKQEHVDIADIDVAADIQSVDVLTLDQALTRIAVKHPRLVNVVELRFFAGLSIEETAECLGIETHTVKRDWQKARVYLQRALEP